MGVVRAAPPKEVGSIKRGQRADSPHPAKRAAQAMHAGCLCLSPPTSGERKL